MGDLISYYKIYIKEQKNKNSQGKKIANTILKKKCVYWDRENLSTGVPGLFKVSLVCYWCSDRQIYQWNKTRKLRDKPSHIWKKSELHL